MNNPSSESHDLAHFPVFGTEFSVFCTDFCLVEPRSWRGIPVQSDDFLVLYVRFLVTHADFSPHFVGFLPSGVRHQTTGTGVVSQVRRHRRR